jgi:hypothetical protein
VIFTKNHGETIVNIVKLWHLLLKVLTRPTSSCTIIFVNIVKPLTLVRGERDMQLVEQHVINRDDPRYRVIDEAAFKSKNLYNERNNKQERVQYHARLVGTITLFG